MGLYKRGGIWWISYTLNRRQRHESTGYKDRRLAEKYANSFLAGVQEGRLFPDRRDATVADVINRYLTIHLKPNRPASFERADYMFPRMIKFLGAETPISQVRAKADEYKAWRKQSGAKPASVKRELSLLKAATRKALEWGMVGADPLAGYKLDKVDDARTRYIEDSEFQRLVN